MSLDIISDALFSQLLMGGMVGFLIGFAVKKIVGVALVLAGIFFGAVAYVEYNHLITLDYEQFALFINGLLQQAGASFVLPGFLGMNMPLLLSFAAALAFGLKKG